MDNYNEQPLLLTGGLTADELPEGRAIYDTNDKFNPNGKDLVSALSWLPTPVGGIAGGVDVWNQMRDQDVDPLLAGTVAAGVGALGTFGLGKLLKYLPKGKMGGYVRLGSNPGEIVSENGKVYNVGNKVNREELIKDANAYELPYRNGYVDPDDYDTLFVDDWLTDVNYETVDPDVFEKALKHVHENPSVISERFMDNLDKQAIDAYSKPVPELGYSTYKHYSEEPLSKIERGYTGIKGGDLEGVGPTSAVYMVDNDTTLKGLPDNYNITNISGPDKNSFLDLNTKLNKVSNSEAYKLLKDVAERNGIDFSDNTPLYSLYPEIKFKYPYINRMLRNNGYAGITGQLPEDFDWHGNIFREYVGFRPEDYKILGSEIYQGR